MDRSRYLIGLASSFVHVYCEVDVTINLVEESGKGRGQLHGGRKQKTGKNCSRVHIIGQLIFKDIKF